MKVLSWSCVGVCRNVENVERQRWWTMQGSGMVPLGSWVLRLYCLQELITDAKVPRFVPSCLSCCHVLLVVARGRATPALGYRQNMWDNVHEAVACLANLPPHRFTLNSLTFSQDIWDLCWCHTSTTRLKGLESEKRKWRNARPDTAMECLLARLKRILTIALML